MAVNLNIPDESAIYPVAGVEIGIAQAGIKKPGRDDLTLFKFTPGTSVAGVFTRNRFRAAPVQICESRLAKSNAMRALVINTGNANAAPAPMVWNAPLRPAVCCPRNWACWKKKSCLFLQA